MRCQAPPSPPGAAAAGQTRDYSVEYGHNSADDGGENSPNGTGDSHETSPYGSQNTLDLFTKEIRVRHYLNPVVAWPVREDSLTQETTAPIVKI